MVQTSRSIPEAHVALGDVDKRMGRDHFKHLDSRVRVKPVGKESRSFAADWVADFSLLNGVKRRYAPSGPGDW
jgi:hypothetical protein